MKLLLSLGLIVLVGVGCGEEGVDPVEQQEMEPDPQPAPTPDPTPEPTPDPEPDPVQVIEHEGGILEIIPGGGTICSRGTEFAYFVKQGDPKRVVVDFQGGGACWDEFTCSVADAIFQPDIENIRAGVRGGYAKGIYDQGNGDNPFKGWTHVIVPYCTGDVHWGDNTQIYAPGQDSEVTIHHRGGLNSQTALDWVYENIPTPDTAVVTGCSAGGYGSIVWGAHVMEHYPEARVVQLADSAAGIITDTFFEEAFPSWQIQKAFPTWISALEAGLDDPRSLNLAKIYGAIGNHYPDRIVAQYNTAFDDNQTFYFQALGGGDANEWSANMATMVEEAESLAPNFHAYIAPGERHCILPFDEFYETEVGGVRLPDWVRSLIEDDEPGSIYCEDCGAP